MKTARCRPRTDDGAKRTPEWRHRFYDAGPGRWNRLLAQLLAKGVESGCLRISNLADASEELTALWMGASSLEVKLGVRDPMDQKSLLAKVDHGIAVFSAYYKLAS